MSQDGELIAVFEGHLLEAQLLRSALKDVGLMCEMQTGPTHEQPPMASLLVPPEFADKATNVIQLAQKDLGGAADTTLMDS